MFKTKLPGSKVNSRQLPAAQEFHLLEEMWRLGFLADESKFTDDELATIRRQVELEHQLESIYQQKSDNSARDYGGADLGSSVSFRPGNGDTQISGQHKKDWQAKQSMDILFLGRGVSSDLNDKECYPPRLARHGLAEIGNVAELAHLMGVNLQELRFLAFSKKVSRVRHYRQFVVTKKTGGYRRISTPMPRLKRIQYWILDNILNNVELHPAAHGFVAKRSIITNAKPHVGSEIVINLDLSDFFPTITYARVKGLFRSLGYSRQIATVLALICSEYDFDEVNLHDESYFVSQGERKLPQGAPTSPAISNLICRSLDRRLSGLASCLGYVYTRYADDLTFSTKTKPAPAVQKLLWRCRRIIEDEGFKVHPGKTCVMRKHQQQSVTGLIVNDKLSISRKLRKKFRALIHQLEKNRDLKKLHWHTGEKSNLAESLRGFAHYMNMIVPESGTLALNRLGTLKKGTQTAPGELASVNFRAKAAQGVAPRADWWEVKPMSLSKSVMSTDSQDSYEAGLIERESAHGSGGADSSNANNHEAMTSSLTAEGKNKTKRKRRLPFLLAAMFCTAFGFAVYYLLR